jgi:hypothetical protein
MLTDGMLRAVMTIVMSLALICLVVLLNAFMLSFAMLSDVKLSVFRPSFILPSVVKECRGAVPSPWACSSVNKQSL